MAECLPCHFEYEEKYARLYLPAPLLAWLIREHRQLQAAGYRRELVEIHAAQEMPVFRRYFPPNVVAQIERDHALFAAGLLGVDCD